jgi:hypothetical protein
MLYHAEVFVFVILRYEESNASSIEIPIFLEYGASISEAVLVTFINLNLLPRMHEWRLLRRLGCKK